MRNIFKISWTVSPKPAKTSNGQLKTNNRPKEDTYHEPRYQKPTNHTKNNYQLDVDKEFTYPGSTATDSLSKQVWDNNKLTLNTKMTVYRACVLSTLLYGSESWTLYSRQARRLNTFHMVQPETDSGHQMVESRN